jgi:hypothetical protein
MTVRVRKEEILPCYVIRVFNYSGLAKPTSGSFNKPTVGVLVII